MKQFFTFLAASIFCWEVSLAQTDTAIALPPGYTFIQFRNPTSIVVDSSNHVWIGFTKVGLAKFNGTTWTVYDSLNSGLLKNKILSLAINTSGIWAGTDTGLFFYHAPFWTHYNSTNSGLNSDTVSNLYSPGGNDLYIYSNRGFTYFNGSSWQHYNTSNSGLVNDTVRCILKSSDGNLWIGTINGLSKFDGSTWQNYTSSNSGLPDNYITALNEDGDQNIFIGTASEGLWILSSNEFHAAMDLVSSYFQFPQKILKLHRMQDGSILMLDRPSYHFYSGGLDATPFNSYSTDTFLHCVLDYQDRIWSVSKFIGNFFPNFFMEDSLWNYKAELPDPSYSDLDINQVRCGIVNNGSLHWDQISNARYEVPKNSFVHSVFA